MSQQNFFLTRFYLKINNQDMQNDFMSDVIEIVVDSSLYLPEMFTVLLYDYDLNYVNDTSLLKLGAPVEISVKPSIQLEENAPKVLLMKGEIAALEPDFSARGQTTLLIRGYNKVHRLHRGKRSRTFLNQSDSDIVRKIAGEVGLSPQVDSTRVVYDYVIQSNQTNMEFLQSRAERLGYKVFATRDKLYFKKGEANLGTGPKLEYGQELISFKPVLSAARQADKIKVMGWDPKQKKAITSQVAPPPALKQGGVNQTGGAAAKSAFGTAETILVDRPVSTPDEAKALAGGLANDLSGDFIQAEGICYGDPEVKAGHTIEITGLGKRFSGKYFVTTATHIMNEQGYETHFGISGRQPNTLSHLLESGNGSGPGRNLMQGVAPALVTNLNDPDNLGRVKVKYDWLGANLESDWLRIAAPMGGAERGFYFLPEVNDEVLIAFEHGDIHRPYIIGVLWSSQDKPPKPNNQVVGSGKVNQRLIQSRSGHLIILDDTEGKEQIVIRDKTGKNEIIIDSAKNTISMNVDQDLNLKAKGKINLEATGDVTIKGANVNIQGQQKGDIQATQIAINGKTKVDIKGAMINLN